MRFRLTTLFFVTAIAGFVVHFIECKVIQQSLEDRWGTLIVFYLGTLTTIFLSAIGNALGQRSGTIAGAVVAFLIWCGLLGIMAVLGAFTSSTFLGVHVSMMLGVSVTSIWILLTHQEEDPIDESPDSHSVASLLESKQKPISRCDDVAG